MVDAQDTEGLDEQGEQGDVADVDYGLEQGEHEATPDESEGAAERGEPARDREAEKANDAALNLGMDPDPDPWDPGKKNPD